MTCSKCKKTCDTIYECDCAEHSDLCKECWDKVPTYHREDACFMAWIDYQFERDK
jgi:hypothetical protein